MGLVACGIFQDQRWNRVQCIDRQILNHWTTREVLLLSFIGITPQPSCNLLNFEFHLGVCYPQDPNWLRRILDESSVSGLWLVDKEEPLRSFKYGKHDQIWILQMLSSNRVRNEPVGRERGGERTIKKDSAFTGTDFDMKKLAACIIYYVYTL